MRIVGKIFALLVLLALVFFLVSYQHKQADAPEAVFPELQPELPVPPPTLVETQSAFIEVYRQVLPAVVNIRAEGSGAAAGGDLFEEFFGDLFKNRPRQKQKSLGSGLLIDPAGYLLTNAHVIAGAEEIQVRLSDQRMYVAKLVGADESTDVAVLKIEGEEPFPMARLGDSEQVQVGEWALAIGNPFGLDRTLTVGVISAKGRSDVGIEEYEDFIQTDASINPGNSGGPLLNIRGEVIGINTAIVASGQGIGFAIPIRLAKSIADQLMTNGEVRRGWLGVRIQALTAELAASFGLKRTRGALVTEVMPGMPAAQAGIQRGDIILRFDGREIHGVRDLQLRVASTLSGSVAEVEVLREGRTLSLQVKVSEREVAAGSAEKTVPRPKSLGFEVATDSDGSVTVSAVDPAGAAAASGLRSGDKILQVNEHEVADLHMFEQAVSAVRKDKNIRLLVRRGESVMYLAFTLP
ncbi:MAG: peptidase [Desulfuromonas sp.]|nr:MAG: peptidase [Desulfuromonas sp.]